MRQECFILMLGFTGIWLNSTLAGDLRLVGGDTPFDGSVEVYMRNDWQLMCDSYLHISVATTVCRQLGYPVTNVTLKNNSITEWDTWIQCKEDSADVLNECNWALWPMYECLPEESLGIACNGNVRLSEGTNNMNGNLETYKDGEIIMLCDHKADSHIAEVVCRQLGFTHDTITVTAGSYFGEGKPSKYYAICNGDESSLEECRLLEYIGSTSCDKDHLLGVECNATMYDVEMFDPATLPTDGGLFNISFLGLPGYWTEPVINVSSQKLKQLQNIASVICYQLGYSRKSPRFALVQSEREWGFPLALSEGLHCTGSEASLTNCAILGNSNVMDNSTTELSIQCLSNIRLVKDNIDTGLDNGLLVFQDETTEDLHPLADVHMDYKAAQVACYELGFGGLMVELKLVSTSLDMLQRALRMEFVCSGREERLRDCQSKPNDATKSDNIVWLNCNFEEPFNFKIQSLTAPTLVAKHLTGGDFLPFCTTNPDLDDSITAGVICGHAGFSRFEAKFIQVAKTSNMTIFDDISRYACLGLEDSIIECPKYGNKLTRSEQCVSVVDIQCQATTACRDKFEDPAKRDVFCLLHYSQLQTSRLEQCSLDDGYACSRETTKERKPGTTAYLTTISVSHCEKGCMAHYSLDPDFFTFKDCCYDNQCNSDKREIHQTGTFRLIDGVLTGEGIVQVYSLKEKDWVFVKDDDRLTHQTLVNICTASGHSASPYVARSPDQFTERTRKFPCMEVDAEICNENISSPDCMSRNTMCIYGERLRISCNARSPVRVQDGGGPGKGRVEIYLNGQWGTVCDKRLSANVIVVICRSLGFGGFCNLNAPRNKNIKFREGQGPIHFTDVNCTGTEKHILQCSYNIVNENSGCTHEHDLGIVCEKYLQPRDIPGNTDTNDSSRNTDESKPTTTSVMSTYDSSFNSATNKTKKCYVGSCVSINDCTRAITMGTRNVCTVYNNTYCYVAVQISAGTRQKSINFGCSSQCNSRNKSLLNLGSQYCCQTSLCNNEGMFSDALFGQVNVTVTNGSSVTDVINKSGSNKPMIDSWMEILLILLLSMLASSCDFGSLWDVIIEYRCS